MTSPRWTASFSTGNPDIDREHQDLLLVVDELKAAATDGDKRARVSNCLDRFQEHVRTHFPHEEQEMEAKDYPQVARHRQSHDALACLVADLLVKQNQGETVLFSEVDHLANALYRHLLLDDKGFVDFLAGKR